MIIRGELAIGAHFAPHTSHEGGAVKARPYRCRRQSGQEAVLPHRRMFPRRRASPHQSLRWATFIFAVLGAILPVLRIYTPTLAPAAGDVALELSVVLIGIAAAFNFADQLLGASSGWRRSEMASVRLNEMLTVFCLDWNELEFRVSLSAETESVQSFHPAGTGPRLRPTPASPDQAPPPACDPGHAAALNTPPTATSPSGSANTGPQCTPSQTLLATAQTITEQQFSMVRSFCLAVLDVVREETSSWAEEFTRSASQFEKELRSGAFAHPRTPRRR
jgi:hypothetical protein